MDCQSTLPADDHAREAQEIRRQTLMAAVRQANVSCFSASGAWACGWPEPSARERFWHALAFLAGDASDVELGNRIIEGCEIKECDFCFGIWRRRRDVQSLADIRTMVELSDSIYQSHRRIECRWQERQVGVLYDMQSEELIWVKEDGQFLERSLLKYSDVNTGGRYVSCGT